MSVSREPGLQSDDASAKADVTTRLASLDALRGLIMFLLVAETTGLIESLATLTSEGTFARHFVEQFHHAPWHGLRFWDLVQPLFMFIVGVAMAFSMAKRKHTMSEAQAFRHILYRCFMLLLFGVGLHCVYAGELRWELWNVLSQLSVTILIAYGLMRTPAWVQCAAAAGLVLVTDVAYRSWPLERFNHPFTQGQNFGTWVDTILMPRTREYPNSGGWVAINCIPTAAHTIWGVVAGQLLLSDWSQTRKLVTLFAFGVALCVLGYGLDFYGVSPIIKRICTSSFIVVSGGWCLVALAAFYLIVDVMGFQRWSFMFVVVGMNSIFIYLFSQTIGGQWLNGTVGIFTSGVLKPLDVPAAAIMVVTGAVVLAVEWWLCYWLYRRKILIKL